MDGGEPEEDGMAKHGSTSGHALPCHLGEALGEALGEVPLLICGGEARLVLRSDGKLPSPLTTVSSGGASGSLSLGRLARAPLAGKVELGKVLVAIGGGGGGASGALLREEVGTSGLPRPPAPVPMPPLGVLPVPMPPLGVLFVEVRL